MMEHSIHELISPKDVTQKEPERITLNVSDLLDDLIAQSVELVGKPVALMTKEEQSQGHPLPQPERRAAHHEIRR